jgi:quinohemoprotein ethanol dehydrogenase
MQAPKNGFFYVLDRESGELISAEPYVKVTWATGIDKATGRPIESPGMRYKYEGKVVTPGPLGGHNWQPMSFSPKTGLVYIPAQDNSMFYAQQKDFVYRPGTWNTGVDFAAQPSTPLAAPSGFLLAWDPVKQQARWRVPHELMWNGGTLATAGDLVFQGLAEGRFVAYGAVDGKQLWDVNIGSGIIATPVTYRIDGVQYVSIMAGWGGAGATMGGISTNAPGRLLTFALSGEQKLAPVAQDIASVDLNPVATEGDEAAAARGAKQYARNCAVCHGFEAIGSGVFADLRLSDEAVFDEYQGIVLDGDMTDSGMPSFEKWLGKQDVADIRHYIATVRNALVKD